MTTYLYNVLLGYVAMGNMEKHGLFHLQVNQRLK